MATKFWEFKADVGYLLLRHLYPEVVKNTDTIDYVIKNRASLCRFGDGEFDMILMRNIPFQKTNPLLAQRLEEIILKGSDAKTLVAIPNVKYNIKFYNRDAVYYFKSHVRYKAVKLAPYLSRSKTWYDASLTRPYIDYTDEERKKAGTSFAHIMQFWSGRDVLIVEGELSRFGVGNDLLSGAKSVKRIIAPAKNAFEVYDRILEATLREAVKYDDVLILTVLGPTATVLSYDLSHHGFQSIDIGHLDVEYEWYLRQAATKSNVPGKYVNEADGYSADEFDGRELEKYRASIVATIEVE
jgi:glycosyltransferase family protein